MTKGHILCVFLMVYIVFLDLEQNIFMEHSIPRCHQKLLYFYKLQSNLSYSITFCSVLNDGLMDEPSPHKHHEHNRMKSGK